MTRHDWTILACILVIIGTVILYFAFARDVLASDLPRWAKIGLLLR